MPINYAVEIATRFHMVFVVGSYRPHKFNHLASFIWLRHLAKQDAMLGGIDTGSNILAKAGLLTGYVCTTHWERMQKFKQDNPRLTVTSDIFAVQARRICCAGGSTSMGMN